MSQFIRAIYENGVFKPLEIPNLTDHQQVRLTIEEGAIEEGAIEEETIEEETVEKNDSGKNSLPVSSVPDDPLAGVRASTGIPDLAENFDDYRLGNRQP